MNLPKLNNTTLEFNPKSILLHELQNNSQFFYDFPKPSLIPISS